MVCRNFRKRLTLETISQVHVVVVKRKSGGVFFMFGVVTLQYSSIPRYYLFLCRENFVGCLVLSVGCGLFYSVLSYLDYFVKTVDYCMMLDFIIPK